MVRFESKSVQARVKYFGEETERLDKLKRLDYASFKASILAVRNMLPDEYRVDGFTDCQMVASDGSMFPRPEAKDELMEYALTQAQKQDDIQVAALILGTGIVAVHPFEDGNGRTSRAVYANLSRGWRKGSKGYGKLRGHAGREMIDFAGVTLEPVNTVRRLLYFESKLTPYTNKVDLQEEVCKRAPRESGHAMSDLLPKRLYMQLGLRDMSRANTDAVLYSFSRLSAEGYGPFPFSEDARGYTSLKVYDAIEGLDFTGRVMMREYAQQYHTLRAKATIDLMGKYGGLPFRERGFPPITVRQYMLQNTKNFLTSSVRYNQNLAGPRESEYNFYR